MIVLTLVTSNAIHVVIVQNTFVVATKDAVILA